MVDKRNLTDDSKIDNRPSPADFDLYLPWACKQLQLGAIVQVLKIYQNEYVSVAMTERSKKGKSRGKLTQSRMEMTVEQEKEDKSVSATTLHQVLDKGTAKAIRVLAIYDSIENLVQIKFEKTNQLPRVLIIVVGLIIQFQNYLTSISIKGGIDQYTVYEISKFLSTSNITDICLDDCYLRAPNYQLLLEKANHIKHLSLCRCKIDDVTVENMCSLLVYPLPASKTLSIINLSSNLITDEGAKFIAKALRSNRQLCYLNLASNMITDAGTAAILEILTEFPLTTEEILASKTRQMEFLRRKSDMIAITIKDLRFGDGDKRIAKRKSIRTAPTGAKKIKADKDVSLVDAVTKNLADVDGALIEKAITIVENAVGNFVDPFSNTNTIVKDGITYCKGNNRICSLNLSFNYLSYLSLKKLQLVLTYQKIADRKPTGLMSVSVEGNSMPIACTELTRIDNILEMNLTAQTRRMSANKKRPPTKPTPRF